MRLSKLECPSCGGTLEIAISMKTGVCLFCGSQFLVVVETTRSASRPFHDIESHDAVVEKVQIRPLPVPAMPPEAIQKKIREFHEKEISALLSTAERKIDAYVSKNFSMEDSYSDISNNYLKKALRLDPAHEKALALTARLDAVKSARMKEQSKRIDRIEHREEIFDSIFEKIESQE